VRSEMVNSFRCPSEPEGNEFLHTNIGNGGAGSTIRNRSAMAH
jgi:hypothetical protein